MGIQYIIWIGYILTDITTTWIRRTLLYVSWFFDDFDETWKIISIIKTLIFLEISFKV